MAVDSNEENVYVDEYGRKFEGVTMVDIAAKDVMVATQVFQVVPERSIDEIDSTTGSEDDGAATSSNTSVVFNDGTVKVLTETVDLNTALTVEAFDGGKEEKKKADKEKAERAAEKKAKEQGERGAE